MKPWRVAIFSVVPSPYQRDFFAALNACPELDLQVFYLEEASPDSPWPSRQLSHYEAVLEGRWFGWGAMRWHWNWNLPDTKDFDIVVINSIMSSVGQSLMRGRVAKQPWLFWGEQLRRQSVWWRGWIQGLLTQPLHHASAIAAVGSRAATDYRRRFPNVSVVSIPYHCELRAFQNIATQRHEAASGSAVVPFTFLFCGQMIARKGLDLLIQAFSHLVTRNEDVRLLLIGREAELADCLKPLSGKIQARIDYRGFIAPDDLPNEFALADAFVLPSRYDGWGVVINQALAAGLPVICSEAVGAGNDLVEQDKNGSIFPTGDADALAETMRSLANDRARAQRWGARSLQKSDAWSLPRGVQRWLAVFQEVAPR